MIQKRLISRSARVDLFVVFCLLALGLVLLSLTPALAESDDASAQSSATPYFYYLNGRKYRLWLRSDMVASFPLIPAALSDSEYSRRINPEQMRRAASAKFPNPRAERIESGVVGLYTISTDMAGASDDILSGSTRAYASSQARQASDDRYKYSEVFSSSPGGEDYLALAGGVFVKFSADWDTDRIYTWLAEQGIASHRAEKVLKNNVYMVSTPQGIEALALANRLHETGEVMYAEPNWWRPISR